MSSNLKLPENNQRLETFGCKLSAGGAHNSRTMMLDEISRLLTSVSDSASADEYRKAILETNILGKGTITTRAKTHRYLRELYALSDQVPLFVVYRELCFFDPSSAPLLSLLVAWSRDPLLRATTSAVLSASVNSEVTKFDLEASIPKAFPNQYSALNSAKIGRNAASSWTQSGHLAGRSRKVRCLVEPRPAALTLALLLGHVGSKAGEQIFTTPWCRLLDLNMGQARALAAQAHREGLINLRAIGSIVEIGFPRYNYLLGEKHESGQQTDR